MRNVELNEVQFEFLQVRGLYVEFRILCRGVDFGSILSLDYDDSGPSEDEAHEARDLVKDGIDAMSAHRRLEFYARGAS